jgi:hypothetical protein
MKAKPVRFGAAGSILVSSRRTSIRSLARTAAFLVVCLAFADAEPSVENLPRPALVNHRVLGRERGETVTVTVMIRGGAARASGIKSSLLPGWFRPGSPDSERVLSAVLLTWNSLALLDAIMFTFRPVQNLQGYLVSPDIHPQALAMTRLLANCQLGFIALNVLLGLTGSERQIRQTFRLTMLVSLGAFRAVYCGVVDGVIKAPWKTAYASLLSLPPILFLTYFAFFF